MARDHAKVEDAPSRMERGKGPICRGVRRSVRGQSLINGSAHKISDSPSTGSDTQSSATGSTAAQHLPRQLNLRDLVLSQVLTVVGSAWVGIAAGLGHAQTVVWLLAFGTFYLPMA